MFTHQVIVRLEYFVTALLEYIDLLCKLFRLILSSSYSLFMPTEHRFRSDFAK